MAVVPSSDKISELIRRIDAAVASGDPKQCALDVKEVLESICQGDEEFLPEHLLIPNPTTYARHLMHVDPEGRYSIIVMVWDKGQGTPIHDHANMWCVECVYRGQIKVVSYQPLNDPETDEIVRFQAEKTIYPGPGEAGALIPPFDYHTIENEREEPSVTIHIYGGEMTWCHAFLPEEGGYRRTRRELSYH